MMNRLADNPVDYVSKGLSGMDGAAQAAMVFNKLFHLPPFYQYIVFAAYAPRTIPCECRRSCCVGQKRNEQWHACIRMIEEAAITQALAGCITHRVLRRGIVQRAFGDKSVTLAEKAGVNKTRRQITTARCICGCTGSQQARTGRPFWVLKHGLYR